MHTIDEFAMIVPEIEPGTFWSGTNEVNSESRSRRKITIFLYFSDYDG